MTPPNPDAQLFAGNFILSRDESTFLHDHSVNLTYPCSWLALAADNLSTIEFGFFDLIDNGLDLGSQWYCLFNLTSFKNPAIYSLFGVPAARLPLPHFTPGNY